MAIVLCVLLSAINAFSQNPSVTTDTKIIAKFDSLPYILKEGQIISKTLRVDNKSEKSLSFSVDIIFPVMWKTLNSRNRRYTIEPGDSIFVPVRIIPHGKIFGNTKYLINAYVLEKDSTPVATSHFYVIREKVSSWELTVEPHDKIYFLNKENTSAFQIGVINTGNENQELLLDFENYRSNIILYDTMGKVVTKTLSTLNLKPNQDTTFKYKVQYADGLRNQRIVDMDSHRPNSESEGKMYTLFAKTSEPKSKNSGAGQKAKRVDFVKLSDQYKANPYGYTYFPLVVDATTTNILGGQPILNLNLRGSTVLENGGTINYFSQTFFANNYYTNQYLLGGGHYLAYFDKKYQVQIGNVGGLGAGTYGSSGRGITARYFITPEHGVGAFYTKSPRFFKAPDRESYGAVYSYAPKIGNFFLGYSKAIQSKLSLKSDYFSLNSSFRLPFRQSLGFNTVYVSHNSALPANTFLRKGFLSTLTYSGVFLDGARLRTSANMTYLSKHFDPYNDGETWIASINGSYIMKKNWTIQTNSFYNKMESKRPFFGLPEYTNYNYRTMVSVNKRRENYFLTPGLFYNVNGTNNREYHSRGLNLGYGNYDFATNRLLSNNIMTGYNRVVGSQPLRDHFFLQYFLMFRYKTIAANLRYSYGNVSAINSEFFRGSRYPQSFGASINYQYQFKNPHFILQNFFSYSYYNWFERHNFTYNPELYYYTNSGWRIRLGVQYNSARSDAGGERVSTDNLLNSILLPETEPVVNRGINVIIGVRKEFGIPIPYSKKKYYNVDFVAFIDLNGNKKKDPNEYTLENVVIGLDKMEVLTNDRGKAAIKNLPIGTYPMYAFSLVDLDGYFPYIEDELEVVKHRTDTSVVYVPFMKGVKIFGKVEVEREDVAKNTERPLDLSGIKIAALNGKTIHTLTERDGSFSFYVPFGKYILNMDENVLGERFKILQNNIELEIDMKTENLFITFYVIESKRKITKKRFDAQGNLIEEGNDGTGMAPGAPGYKGPLVDRVAEANAEAAKVKPAPTYDVAKDAFLKDKTDLTKTKGLVYTIQIGAFQKPLNPKVFDGMKQIYFERVDNNFVRICAGKFTSESSAQVEKENLVRVGFPGAYVTAYYNGKAISLAEAAKIKE